VSQRHPGAQRSELIDVQQGNCTDCAARMVRMAHEPHDDTSPISAGLCANTPMGEQDMTSSALVGLRTPSGANRTTCKPLSRLGFVPMTIFRGSPLQILVYHRKPNTGAGLRLFFKRFGACVMCVA